MYFFCIVAYYFFTKEVGKIVLKKEKVTKIVIDSLGIALRLREALSIVYSSFCLLLLMALSSYNQNDPSWSNSSSQKKIENICGYTGSYVADMLFLLVGYLAYIAPLLLGIKAYKLFKEKKRECSISNLRLIPLRIIGATLIALSGSALFDMYLAVSPNLPSHSGGILGIISRRFIEELLGVAGGTILLVACLLISISALVDLSWFTFLENISILAKKNSKYLRSLLILLYSRLPRIKISRNKMLGSLTEESFKNRNELSGIKNSSYKKRKNIKFPDHYEDQLSKRINLESSQEKIDLISVLDEPEKKDFSHIPESISSMGDLLQSKLQDFGIEATIDSVHPGPVITCYEICLSSGSKVSKITSLSKDLARSLAVSSVRIVEIIAGKTTVGIEIPNENRRIIRIKELLSEPEFKSSSSRISLCLGYDVRGKPTIVDLEKMPHLLVAGTTGSGKSVGINAMILSILLKSHPEDTRLIMIDPKMLELPIYDGIPHLLQPVVTDMEDAKKTLEWSILEMERRYSLMSKLHVRSIMEFNKAIKEPLHRGDISPNLLRRSSSHILTSKKLPNIVIIIDEFADMVMSAGKDIENMIARICQKARAAGIHLILATQRPSVDVITGLIKANIPTRISFQVSSKVDSRTIIDQNGAEQLLGHGDMLYMPPTSSIPIRIHGAFVSDKEVKKVVEEWKKSKKDCIK